MYIRRAPPRVRSLCCDIYPVLWVIYIYIPTILKNTVAITVKALNTRVEQYNSIKYEANNHLNTVRLMRKCEVPQSSVGVSSKNERPTP